MQKLYVKIRVLKSENIDKGGRRMDVYKIAVIAGDGIGPEVINEGVKVLKKWLGLPGIFLSSSHIFHGDANIILSMVKCCPKTDWNNL